MPPSGFLISCARPAATARELTDPAAALAGLGEGAGRDDVVQEQACCLTVVAVAVDHRRRVRRTTARRPNGARELAAVSSRAAPRRGGTR